jgi:peptidoglycan/LPS O-acetylase OafA/YrhL
MAATKWLLTTDLEGHLSSAAPQGQTARFLAWCGRRSLVIYLVHQPVLLAVIVPVSRLLI